MQTILFAVISYLLIADQEQFFIVAENPANLGTQPSPRARNDSLRGQSDALTNVDVPNQLNNLSRCSKTKLVVNKESLFYNWELGGFLGYFSFMKKFDQIFELKTEEVSFKSDIVDGKWYFKLNKVVAHTRSSSPEEIIITSIYSYEAKTPKNLHFHIQLNLHHDEQEIVLPLQKSLNPVVMQQRLYNRRGYSSYFEYIHTFTWNLGAAFENMLNDSNVGMKEEQFLDSQMETKHEDIFLKFFITAFYPLDPVYKGSENCFTTFPFSQNDQGMEMELKELDPPYIQHSTSMMHDAAFSDVQIIVGEQSFLAHRIILAYSSPVLSSLLHSNNATAMNRVKEKTNSTSHYNDSSELIEKNDIDKIHINESTISGEIVQELLRYIYTGTISLKQYADKLIIAANIYEMPELKKICEKFLYHQIAEENAVRMYQTGREANSSRIVKRAFTILKKNKSKMTTQSGEFGRLTTKYPELMFELFLS